MTIVPNATPAATHIGDDCLAMGTPLRLNTITSNGHPEFEPIESSGYAAPRLVLQREW